MSTPATARSAPPSAAAVPAPRSSAPNALPAAHRNLPTRSIGELFERQRTARELLPDPRPLAVNLTRYLVEILAGVRDPEQIARWVEAGAHAALVQNVVVRTRARRARHQVPTWPRFQLGPTRVDAPADGIVECVTVIHQQSRCYPIALRLVGLDGRWHAVVIDIG